jgi:hypothetical protein
MKSLRHNPRDNIFQFGNRKHANENISLSYYIIVIITIIHMVYPYIVYDNI